MALSRNGYSPCFKLCRFSHIREIGVILTGKNRGWKSNSTVVEAIAQICSTIRSVARGHILDVGKKVEAKFVLALLELSLRIADVDVSRCKPDGPSVHPLHAPSTFAFLAPQDSDPRTSGLCHIDSCQAQSSN
jgi:hypothetical protein